MVRRGRTLQLMFPARSEWWHGRGENHNKRGGRRAKGRAEESQQKGRCDMNRLFWLVVVCVVTQQTSVLAAQKHLLRGTEYPEVLCVAFSPDSKILASGNADHNTTLWDVASEKVLAVLRGHNGFLCSVVFNADGKTLASASSDKTIRLWDVRTGKNIATYRGHNGEVRALAFSPDGKTLASACCDVRNACDRTIKLWNVETGKNTKTFQGAGFTSLAFSPNGRTLASGCWDATIRLWDVKTGENTTTLRGHNKPVCAVAFSPDGKTLASSEASDAPTRLWDVATWKTIAVLRGCNDAVESAAFSSDGKVLATGTLNGHVEVWDIAAGKRIASLEAGVGAMVAFSPDGSKLAAGFGESEGGGGIYLWDVRSFRGGFAR